MKIVEAKNLGKKYVISHQQGSRSYQTLRETITNKVKNIFTHPSKAVSPKEDFWALKNVTFDIEKGDRIGIIGRNGAGKSTLLKLLSRITEPSEGKIIIKGKIASLLEVGTGFHPELTGRENIFLNGAVLGMTRSDIRKKFDEIVAFAEVEKFLDTPVKRYSSGMYVRLAFSVAAHLEPDILLVDEVLAVGDAQFQKKSLGKMEEVSAGEGRTVIFVSHNMSAIENLCNKSILLEKGEIIIQDRTNKVINHYLENVLPNIYASTPIIKRTDRSGTGIVKFTYFHVKDSKGNIISVAKSGEDVILVFGFECNNIQDAKNVDVGFSIHTYNNYMLGLLYSSHMGKLFNFNSKKGEICFRINSLTFSEGRYNIGSRVLVNGIESDWLKDGIGFLDVLGGDFYGTGKLPDHNAPLLIQGEWIKN